MPSYSRSDVLLVRYPFSDLSGEKLRPAIVVGSPHPSADYLVVALTSRTTALTAGEFVLSAWLQAGLNVPSAVKRGIATAHPSLVVKRLGQLESHDAKRLDQSLRHWLGL
jgi:mRNA interferase MazF